ncbi:hypothetical protein CR513_37045, partial [Mucuna pruriens]
MVLLKSGKKNNTYVLDMPHTYKGSHIFHVSDLSSFSGDLDSNVRSNSFQEGEPDTNLDNIQKDIGEKKARDNKTPKGPMTRGRLRKLHKEKLRGLEDSGPSPSPSLAIYTTSTLIKLSQDLLQISFVIIFLLKEKV